MESLLPVDLTGRIPAVLEDGVAHDPKRLREVNEDTDDDEEEIDDDEEEIDDEETDYEPEEDKELQQLILENNILKSEASALLELLTDTKDKQIELLGKHILRGAELTKRFRKCVEKRIELAKFLFSGQSSK